MLTKVRVRGFKCLHEVEVELGAFNVLIGRNDSGKSSFLQAVAEPSRSWLGGPSMNYAEVCRGTFNILLGTDKGSLEFDAASWSRAVHRPDDATTSAVSGDTASREKWMAGQPEFITTPPISLAAARIAENAPRDSRELGSMIWAQGKGTAAYLGTLALGDRPRFARIENNLVELTGGRIREIVVDDIGGSTYALAFRLNDKTLVPAAHLSQGLLTYLGFLAIIDRDPVPSTVLIEEPENGLHPLRLFELVQLLRSLNERGVQVILTTHSPDLLSACQPSEVRVFLRPSRDAPTEVHTLPDDFAHRAMRDPLGQVWASRGEEGLLDRFPAAVEPMIVAEPKPR